MRRFGVLGIALLASACSGFGDFVGDVFTVEGQPNRPVGHGENMQRMDGVDPPVEALTTEPGNIWPGPVKLQPSLLNALGTPLTGPGAPGGGAGLPPGLQNPALPAPGQPLQPMPGPTGRPAGGAAPELNFPGLPKPNVPYAPPPGPGAPPLSRVPKGPEPIPGELSTQPVVIDNGNGTSTIIKPDGTIQTVPTSSLKQP